MFGTCQVLRTHRSTEPSPHTAGSAIQQRESTSTLVGHRAEAAVWEILSYISVDTELGRSCIWALCSLDTRKLGTLFLKNKIK
jgi:hypothetical protein